MARHRKSTQIDADLRNALQVAADRHGSVNALAKAAGVPQTSLAAYLRGESGLSWAIVARLCDHLGYRLEKRVDG